MAVTIIPSEASDAQEIIPLNLAAFPETYSNLFEWPLKEESIQALVDQRVKMMTEENEEIKNQENPAKRFFAFKAVDDETGQIVAESRWKIYYEDEVLTKTVEEEAAERVKTPTPQMHVERFRGWGKMLSQIKRAVLAVAHDGTDIEEKDLDKVTRLRARVYLHVLAVHPDHQRKGIGRKLLQWGLDEADRLGLIAYLEASPEGLRLYEQNGYKRVKITQFDLNQYGGTGSLLLTAMIRQPKPKN